MAKIVEGKKIADQILKVCKQTVFKRALKPRLAVILVGADPASATYVRKKQEAAESIGIECKVYRFEKNISNTELISQIRKIQSQKLSGIIVQLPLPKGLDKKSILNELKPDIDVDYLSWESLGKLVIGENPIVPAAPGAILEILDFYKVKIYGRHVVVVGQGDLIGKPLVNLLIQKPMTVTACNKQTKDLAKITRQADILITGVGEPGLIRANMVKAGAVVIDAGTSFVKGKIFGDVDFKNVSKKASLITPTPGGVGPITVAKLLQNTVSIALSQNNK
ncbi:MAG: bifunctional 5,10-methylenetetrahydrofolate dehydrogenase/5,10-methenyltetrahydrofolate cyclohydrolase [Acidobacteriaceae bacterium]